MGQMELPTVEAIAKTRNAGRDVSTSSGACRGQAYGRTSGARFFSASDVLAVQRSHGNAVVARLLSGETGSSWGVKGAWTAWDRAALGPTLQRLLLGREGELDTKKPTDFEAIKRHLSLLDYDSLETIKGELQSDQSPTALERLYVLLIQKEQLRADMLREVTSAGEGIWSRAAVFFDGRLVHSTGAAEAGVQDPKGRFGNVHPLDSGWLGEEQRASQKDSEVGTLSDAFDAIEANAGLQVAHIRVLLVGNMGPCEGCQDRVMAFLREVRALFGDKQVTIEVESNYTSVVPARSRLGTETRYGYSDAQPDVSARRTPYYWKVIDAP